MLPAVRLNVSKSGVSLTIGRACTVTPVKVEKLRVAKMVAVAKDPKVCLRKNFPLRPSD
ncbi:MAG: hypothetical protein FJ194_13415 [Gammaproteobacteria bacterium]|nr:hypothetical protein [Gammaproteobacteria bacterium]